MGNDDSLELRVMSYNVYGCVDANRKINVQKIIKIIKQIEPDIIALQEVDDETTSSANRNQARIIGIDGKGMPALSIFNSYALGTGRLHVKLTLR